MYVCMFVWIFINVYVCAYSIQVKLYQTWPGKHSFYFDGLVMTGNDFPLFLLSNAVILVLSLLFFGVIVFPIYNAEKVS